MVLAARCGTQATAAARSTDDRRYGSGGAGVEEGASVTEPAVGRTSPARASSSVDLPDPLGPTTASADPPGTARSRSSTAVVARGSPVSGWEVRRTVSPRAHTAGSVP